MAMASVLKEPRKKGHSNQRVGNPLPVLVESETGIPAHLTNSNISCCGVFNGDCVVVNNSQDISSLYNMGFFGKGTLSQRCPRSIRKNVQPEVIRERQWKRRCGWLPSNTEGTASNNEQEEGSTEREAVEVVVIADKDVEGDDFISELRPRIEMDSISLPEALNLLLEEALFLCYGLGCLYIFDVDEKTVLNCSEFFSLCLESDTRFLQRYVAYHHFRSKGWVVKSGLKFGGDFLLYKEGPSFYHASYVVSTRIIYGKNSVESDEFKEEKMDWITLIGLNRLAETSGKEVLVCYIVWPSEILPNQTISLSFIKKFKVHEVLLQRWQSSLARIECNEVQMSVE